MASSRPRLVPNEDEPSDIKFYRLSLEREQARARRLTAWLAGALLVSLVLNGALGLWVANSTRRADAATEARARVSEQELTQLRRQVQQQSADRRRVAALSEDVSRLRQRIERLSEAKIGTARKEMNQLRRCLDNARASLRRAITQTNQRRVAGVLRSLKLPACR